MPQNHFAKLWPKIGENEKQRIGLHNYLNNHHGQCQNTHSQLQSADQGTQNLHSQHTYNRPEQGVLESFQNQFNWKRGEPKQEIGVQYHTDSTQKLTIQNTQNKSIIAQINHSKTSFENFCLRLREPLEISSDFVGKINWITHQKSFLLAH
jgi:hypothetical protein